FAALAVAVVAELAQRVVLAFQIGTGDVVEEQGGGSSAAGQIVAPQSFLDLVLAGAEIVQRGIEVVFIEVRQAEHFGDGVIARPAHGRQTRALMSDASQDQEHGEFAESLLPEGASEAQVGSDLVQRMKQAEDGSTGGIGSGEMVEFAAQQPAESVD